MSPRQDHHLQLLQGHHLYQQLQPPVGSPHRFRRNLHHIPASLQKCHGRRHLHLHLHRNKRFPLTMKMMSMILTSIRHHKLVFQLLVSQLEGLLQILPEMTMICTLRLLRDPSPRHIANGLHLLRLPVKRPFLQPMLREPRHPHLLAKLSLHRRTEHRRGSL